jgi:hypothetical protein
LKTLHIISSNSRTILKYLLIGVVVINGFYSCKKSNSTGEPPVVMQNAPVSVSLIHTLPGLLTESSGLCYTEGNLWTFGDSGNPNALFKIDTISGAILQVVTIQNYPNEDWEDITADSSFIYVGDFGNNDGNRKDLRIIRIKKSDLNSTSSQVSINADAISFSYADQQNFNVNSNTNFNCEALVAIDSSLYIFTKDGGDLQTRCYKLPKDTGTYSVSPISTFNTQGKITSAAYNPVTKELALGGYMNRKVFPFIWFFKGYSGDNFFEGAAIRESLTTKSTPWQTEGIDYKSSGQLFLSCESTPEIGASLYSVKLNFDY